MIIRRLSLSNYRKFKSLDLEFPEGLMGVVGRNGMGKTTIVEAIAFGLYGANASRTGAKSIRREGTSAEDDCVVTLEFSVGGEPYRIERRIRGEREVHSAVAYHGSNPEPVASRATGVEQLVSQLVGMDYATFIRSVFARQKEIQALSDAQPEERRRTIRRMIGIDKIDQAIQNARRDCREKQVSIETAQRALENLPGKLQEQETLTVAVRDCTGAVARVQKLEEKANSKRRLAKEKFDALDALRTQHEKLERTRAATGVKAGNAETRFSELRAELAGLSKRKQDLRRIRPQARKYEQVRQQKERMDRAQGAHDERLGLEEEVRGLNTELAQAQEQLKRQGEGLGEYGSLSKDRRENARALAAANRSLAAVQKNLRLARAAHERAKAQVGDLRGKAAQVRRLGASGQCPTCLRDLAGDYEGVLQHLNAELEPIASSLAEHGKKVKALGLQEAAAAAELKRLEADKARLAAQHSKRERKQAEFMATKKDVARLHKTVAAKGRRITTLSRLGYDAAKHQAINTETKRLHKVASEAVRIEQELARIPTIEDDIKRTSSSLRALRAETKAHLAALRQLRFKPPAYQRAKTTYDSACSVYDESRTALAEVRQKLAVQQESLRRLGEEIGQLQSLKNQIASDEECARYLTRLVSLLGAFRDDLAARVRPMIAEQASVLMDQVTKGRYTRVDLDEDYNIRILDGSAFHSIGRFSGGEEDLANLCLRVAISQTIALRAGSDPTFIVLDEIFGSQDEERRETVLRALNDLAGSFRQILLISHIEDIHDRVPFLLKVTEDGDRASVANWVQ